MRTDIFTLKRKQAKRAITGGRISLLIFCPFFFLALIKWLNGVTGIGLVLLFGFFALLGLGNIQNGKTELQLYDKFSIYQDAMMGSTVITVADLASQKNLLPDHVRLDIEEMIRKGYIEYIVPGDRENTYVAYIGNTGIHMTGQIPKTDKEIQEEKRQQSNQKKTVEKSIVIDEPKKVIMTAVTCESCGGITQIPIKTDGICDYCGSKIKG